MLDLACQDSSSEKTIGYHEKNKHMVKWLTGGKKKKKELREGYWKTEEDFSER